MNVSLKKEAYRVEAMMSALQNECFNVCCKDLSKNELEIAEVQCVERCAHRYLETYYLVDDALLRLRHGGKEKMH